MQAGCLMATALMVLSVSGCSVLQREAQKSHAETSGWSEPKAYTTGDVRIAIARIHPLLKNEVIGSEPSPDIAKAVAAGFSANVKTNGNSGGGLSGDSAEPIAERAGHSAALVGLLDALFHAFEDYSGGIIGRDSYGPVTARYHA